MKPTIVLGGNMYDDSTIEHFLKDAAEIGYTGVEIRGVGELQKPEAISRNRALEIKAMLDGYGLKPTNLSLFVGNFSNQSEEENQAQYERWLSYLGFAETIGCEMMRLNPGFQHAGEVSEEDYDKSVHWFQACADAANESGVKAVVEIHHGTLCEDEVSSLAYMKAVARSNTGLILDPVNMYQVPTPYGIEVIKRLKPYLLNVHVKDIVQLSSMTYPWAFEYSDYVTHIGKYHRVVPKQGNQGERYFCHRLINQGGIDWHEVFKGLAEIGYDGYLTAESVSKKGSELPVYKELAEHCYYQINNVLHSVQNERLSV